MTDEQDSNTVYGVAFGPLKPALREHSYPVTRSELIEQYGGFELEHADGSDRLSAVLQEADAATFRDPRQVRDAVLDALEPAAVEGRSSPDGSEGTGDGREEHDDAHGEEPGDGSDDGGDGTDGPGDWSQTSV
ncbi:DUF5789 family protein [Halorubrum tibetense]|uniref:DUF2795 domain-containing protein n=1 Tax=Halorubrum tibetense TaxID=175631 RepID=A0ABD5SAR6_9EURY